MSQARSQDQDTLAYLIVDFPEESKNGEISMALISSTWLFEEHGILFCHWPAYLKSTLSRERVVRNHTPLIYSKCVKCVVVVKHSSDDYDKACLKLKKLEEESEHSSTTDIDEVRDEVPHLLSNFSKKSYKSNRNVDFIYSEGSDDDNIPVPPRFFKEKTLKPYTELKSLAQAQVSLVPEDRFQNNYSNSSYLSQDPLIMKPKESNEIKHMCHCEKNSKMLERLLRDIQSIKLDIKGLLQESNNTKLTEFQQLDGQLHFKDYQDLQRFNEKLLEEDYFNKMQATFSLLGGRDVNDTTRKILSLLLSHELSLHINWIGANDKGSLQKAGNVLKLIYGAVRKNHATSSATNWEIDNAIRNWIKNAPDRAGGRANRRNKNSKVQVIDK